MVCGVLAGCRYGFLVLLNLEAILTIVGTAVRGVDFVGNVDFTA